jgi:hypothetical protein
MMTTSELTQSLKAYWGGNKSRLDCFVQMLLGLIAVRTVNLQEVALGFASHAQVRSRYRRLQRFFGAFEMDYVKLARWIFQLFYSPADRFYLIADRTNWYWGKQKINVFLLSVAYEGLAIPLFWQLLDKGGSSDATEQIALIQQFVNTFGTDHIAGLLMDREFGNGRLFHWLNQHAIPFYIRIQDKSQVVVGRKKCFSAKKCFADLKPNERRFYPMTVKVFGQSVHLAGSRSQRGELMVVATNQPPQNAIAIYLRRWEIENLFQSLKSRGFRFEETHMTCPKRIKKLMALLAVGFAWLHKIGEWLSLKKPIPLKQFRHFKTPQSTYFRYGLDYLREILLHRQQKESLLQACIPFICPLPNTENQYTGGLL